MKTKGLELSQLEKCRRKAQGVGVDKVLKVIG